jgi:hypothetical protein
MCHPFETLLCVPILVPTNIIVVTYKYLGWYTISKPIRLTSNKKESKLKKQKAKPNKKIVQKTLA